MDRELIIRRIADNLSKKRVIDLTEAERQVVRILVDTGRLKWVLGKLVVERLL